MLFAIGLAVWTAVGVRLLPFLFHDLRDIFSLEDGRWGTHEWVHPLYVPVLGAYGALLGILGYEGRMLVPVEILNVAVGAFTLAALFVFVEKRCRDSIAAALCVLLLGFSAKGFWPHSLRASPYALGAACVTAALLLLAGAFERQPARTRYALAGAAAGLAAGFHAAALALVPTALCAALWEARRTERRPLKLFVCFLAAFVPVVCAGYAVFFSWHATSPDIFFSGGFGDVFRAVESIPGTSIYSSRSPAAQLAGYGRTLLWEHAEPLLPLAAVFLALLASARKRPENRALLDDQGVRVAFANLCFFSLFFLINNYKNSFIFAGLMLLPLPLAMMFSRRSWTRAVFVLICAPTLVVNARRMEGSAFGPRRDPLLTEARYLRRLLGPRDVLLAPGCPFPELFYLGHLNVIQVGEPGPLDADCEAPRAPLAMELLHRVASYQSGGGRVFLAAAGGEAAADMGGPDFSRGRQIFHPAARPADARDFLDSVFGIEKTHVSPQGREYLELGPSAGYAAAAKGASERVNAGEDVIEDPWRRRKAAYLRRWLEDLPDDGYARGELSVLLKDVGTGRARSKGFGELDAALERALFEVKAGDREGALRSLAVARSHPAGPGGTFVRVALAYQDLGRCADAVAVYERLIAEGRGTAEILQNKGLCEYLKGSPGDAIRDLEEAIRRDPGLLSAHITLASVYESQRRPREALKIYDLALSAGRSEDLVELRRRIERERERLRSRMAKD